MVEFFIGFLCGFLCMAGFLICVGVPLIKELRGRIVELEGGQ